MTIFQILILIFVAFVIYKSTRRLIKKEISLWLFLFWISIWIFVAIVGTFPVIIEKAAELVGIGRGVDLVIYTAVFALFYFLFKIYVRVSKVEKDISQIVRKIAIDKAEKTQE